MFRPDQLARGIHGNRRLFTTQLDDNSTVIKTNSNSLLALLVSNTPCSLEAVVQRLLKSVGVRVPYPDGTIFRAGDDDGQFRVVAGKRDVVGVAFEGSDQGLGGVIPNLNGAVVGGGKEVRLVGVRVVVDVVDTLGLVGLEGEIGC